MKRKSKKQRNSINQLTRCTNEVFYNTLNEITCKFQQHTSSNEDPHPSKFHPRVQDTDCSWLIGRKHYKRLYITDENGNNLLHIIAKAEDKDQWRSLSQAISYMMQYSKLLGDSSIIDPFRMENDDRQIALQAFNPAGMKESDMAFLTCLLYISPYDKRCQAERGKILRKYYPQLQENIPGSEDTIIHLLKESGNVPVDYFYELFPVDYFYELLKNRQDQLAKNLLTQMAGLVAENLELFLENQKASEIENSFLKNYSEYQDNLLRKIYCTVLFQLGKSVFGMNTDNSSNVSLVKKSALQARVKSFLNALITIKTNSFISLCNVLVLMLSMDSKNDIYPALNDTLKNYNGKNSDKIQEITSFAFSELNSDKLEISLKDIQPSDPFFVILLKTAKHLAKLPKESLAWLHKHSVSCDNEENLRFLLDNRRKFCHVHRVFEERQVKALLDFKLEPFDFDLLYFLLDLFKNSQDPRIKRKREELLINGYELHLENIRNDKKKHLPLYKLLISGSSENALQEVYNKLIMDNAEDKSINNFLADSIIKFVENFIKKKLIPIVKKQRQMYSADKTICALNESQAIKKLYLTTALTFLKRFQKLSQKQILEIDFKIPQKTEHKTHLFVPLIISLYKTIETLSDSKKYKHYGMLFQALKTLDEKDRNKEEKIIFFTFVEPDLNQLKKQLKGIDPDDPLFMLLTKTLKYCVNPPAREKPFADPKVFLPFYNAFKKIQDKDFYDLIAEEENNNNQKNKKIKPKRNRRKPKGKRWGKHKANSKKKRMVKNNIPIVNNPVQIKIASTESEPEGYNQNDLDSLQKMADKQVADQNKKRFTKTNQNPVDSPENPIKPNKKKKKKKKHPKRKLTSKKNTQPQPAYRNVQTRNKKNKNKSDFPASKNNSSEIPTQVLDFAFACKALIYGGLPRDIFLGKNIDLTTNDCDMVSMLTSDQLRDKINELKKTGWKITQIGGRYPHFRIITDNKLLIDISPCPLTNKETKKEEFSISLAFWFSKNSSKFSATKPAICVSKFFAN